MKVYIQFYRAIDKAICDGLLTEPFNSKDVENVCLGFSRSVYKTYLSKFSQGNSINAIELFQRVDRGTYRRLPFYVKRDYYIDLLEPLFLPDDPISNDIIKYFSSLLRLIGMEDKGWDPYSESRFTINDLNGLFKLGLPRRLFPKPQDTHWRLGLLMYSHIVEMDAPYEVILNLLRFKIGEGYNPNPFYKFLSEREQKTFKKRGLSTGRKIEIINVLSKLAQLNIAPIFEDFYDNNLRNSISHSDYILIDNGFRCRGGISGDRGFTKSFEELDEIILSAKAFIAAFFSIEHTARKIWGQRAGKAFPYDLTYKGLMEVLADEDGLMCGFKVHWPNETSSTYRRTKDGVEMKNCMLSSQQENIDLMVGMFVSKPSAFSPLVKYGALPVYTKREGNQAPLQWPGDGTV